MFILTFHNVQRYWSYNLKNSNYICVGRRKSSVARVSYKKGNGKIVVNNCEVLDYFKRKSLPTRNIGTVCAERSKSCHRI